MIGLNGLLMVGIVALANLTFAKGSAQQINRTGNFDLPCSADTAFPFFSPEGEREWVNGWDPRPVFPDHIEFSRDTVFRQGQGDEEAVWTIVDVDWQVHRAEYVRVAPHSHSARIVVKVEPLGRERSSVIVTYTVTAFGENAETLLEGFSERNYSAKMRKWKQKITTYLENRKLAEDDSQLRR